MQSKKIPKTKKKQSRSKLVKKLDAVFSQYIRLKNAVDGYAVCFTCGKKDHWKKLQNGHFQSRKHYATRWDEQNCQVQCAGCNVFKFGEQFIFGKNLDEKYYAGIADELYIKSKQVVKFTNNEIEDMILKYKKLVDNK
jgi:hypothetical protein